MWKALLQLLVGKGEAQSVEPELASYAAALRAVAGDTVVITCEHHLTLDQHNKIEAMVLRQLPVGVKALVLGRGLKLTSVCSSNDTLVQLLDEVRKQNRTLRTIAECGVGQVLRTSVL